MEVYLIRHGIAAERGTYADDDARPLVTKGIEKTTQVARRLVELGVNFDVILTSPLVRAQQTAKILLTEKLSDRLEEFDPLAPGGDLNAWLNWYDHSDAQKVALVGHQPDLGNWTEMLVWGTIKEQIVVKKAGVIGINVPSRDKLVGNCQLFLLTAPKWFI